MRKDTTIIIDQPYVDKLIKAHLSIDELFIMCYVYRMLISEQMYPNVKDVIDSLLDLKWLGSRLLLSDVRLARMVTYDVESLVDNYLPPPKLPISKTIFAKEGGVSILRPGALLLHTPEPFTVLKGIPDEDFTSRFKLCYGDSISTQQYKGNSKADYYSRILNDFTRGL